MKKKYSIIGLCAFALMGVSALAVYKTNTTNTIVSTEQKRQDTQTSSVPLAFYEQVAKEVKAQKESVIVGKVLENGYLQKHGNHYHFVYGAPPADAIYETLQTEATNDHYTFNPKDIVGEDANGYIVKHGDHFHYIFKTQHNKRTEQGVVSVEKSNHTTEVHHDDHDHYTFNKKDVVSEDANGYVVKHDDHFHYIYKDKKTNDVVAHHDHQHKDVHDHDVHDDHDHYTFDKKDVVSEDEHGYVVKHGNHYHYIYKDKKAVDVVTHHDHDHDGDKHDDDKHNETPHNAVDELTAKKQYISEVYGVPFEAIRVNTDYFIFNDPGHAYDPSHIHPYVIPVDQMIIPAVVGIPEIDFETELFAVAKRSGVPVHELKISNNKFVLSHGDHSHFINIKQLDGMKAYFDNKLPDIKGDYVTGSFDKQQVFDKIEALKEKAKQRYTDAVVYRRIERALDALKADVETLVTNSTDGYLAMLNAFDRNYIEHTTPQQDKKETNTLAKRYEQLTDLLKQLSIEKYGVTKEEILETLKTAMDTQSEDKIDAIAFLLEELKRVEGAQSVGMATITYLDYFLKNINDEKVALPLKDDLAMLLMEGYKVQSFKSDRRFKDVELVVPFIQKKREVKEALKSDVPVANVDSDNSDGIMYYVFKMQREHEEVPKTWEGNIIDYINSLREFSLNRVPKEALAEGFSERITPLPENRDAEVTPRYTAPPSVEEDDEAVDESEATVERRTTALRENNDTEHEMSSAQPTVSEPATENSVAEVSETTPKATTEATPENTITDNKATENTVTTDVAENRAVENDTTASDSERVETPTSVEKTSETETETNASTTNATEAN